MAEEITEETEGVFPPAPGVHETSNPGRKRYGSFGEFINSMPKLAPKPAPKQGPSLHDHYNRMSEARVRYKTAVAGEEARKQKALSCQEELLTLEAQKQDLGRQKANALQAGDKTKMVALSQDIEIIQYQITQRSTELDALLIEEDCKTILHEVRKTEQQFCAMQLDSYKKQVTAGKCQIPFSELLRRAYALGSVCGVGRVRDFLFQWVGEPSLSGADVEAVIEDIEKEYRDE